MERTLNFIPSSIRHLRLSCRWTPEFPGSFIVPVDIRVQLGQLCHFIEVIVSFLNAVTFFLLAAFPAIEMNSSEILNSNAGAIGVLEIRIRREGVFREVWGIVPDSLVCGYMTEGYKQEKSAVYAGVDPVRTHFSKASCDTFSTVCA